MDLGCPYGADWTLSNQNLLGEFREQCSSSELLLSSKKRINQPGARVGPSGPPLGSPTSHECWSHASSQLCPPWEGLSLQRHSPRPGPDPSLREIQVSDA